MYLSTVYRVLAGIGVLIGIYLFLNNYKASASIISTLGGQTVDAISVLQGRTVKAATATK